MNGKLLVGFQVARNEGKRLEERQMLDGVQVDLREQAKQAAKWFNGSATWMPLARALAKIKDVKTHREWGFSSFSAYVEDDLDLKKNVASELVLAYTYLAFRHDECLEQNSSAAEHIPSYANIVILARKAPRLPESVVDILDQQLFAGTIKRKILKEAIEKELSRFAEAVKEVEESDEAQDHRQDYAEQHTRPHPQEVYGALTTFYEAIDLKALWDEIILVFEDWGEANMHGRRQLLGQLRVLIDQLEEIKQKLELGLVS